MPGYKCRQSWNLGVNPGSVTGLPPEATASTYCMGGSRPWALHRVLVVEIKLDGAGYVAGGENRGQGAPRSQGEPPRSQRHARERLPAAQYGAGPRESI